MSRPRKPTAVLETKGAFAHDPQRRAERANEPIPDGPIGDHPEWFSDDQIAVWNELMQQVPENVLTVADRVLVEMYCMLVSRLRSGETLKAAELNLVFKFLSSMGLTPADRSRIHAPSKKKQEAQNTFDRLAAQARGKKDGGDTGDN